MRRIDRILEFFDQSLTSKNPLNQRHAALYLMWLPLITLALIATIIFLVLH